MRNDLISRGSKKSRPWLSSVGFSLAELEKRLNETMPEGYTWDDFLSGRLHIDHTTPRSAFNYETENDLDFARCWSLSNLQLLPAAENLAKSNRMSTPFQPSLCF
jgi:hypothetical protein